MGKPTINDVARVAGVSKKTVSRVINRSPMLADKTRTRVEGVIAELGYVPDPQARALALGHSLLVALVHDGSDPGLFAQALEGALDALEGSDFAIATLRLGNGKKDGLSAFLARHRPAAAIFLPLVEDRSPLVDACRSAKVRGLWLGHCRAAEAARPDGDQQFFFPVDERAAMAGLVTRLVELGHSRIAFVAGPEGSSCSQARELGYLDAMADHGLDRGPALIENGDFSLESGRAAGVMLLSISPAPTAIIATNDAMAAGVLQAARAKGLAVPEDLSVTGFGDSALAAQLSPPLASVTVPWREMARVAAARAIGGAEPVSALETRLEPRETVASKG
jgi:LacI family transcriptional regulator